MTPDYPAAHSMDTSWFAVDRDGHIGHFSTGEGGALPFDASEEPDELMDQVVAALPRTEVIYDLKGPVCPGPLGAKGEHVTTWASGQEEALFFLRSLDPVRAEVRKGQAVRVPGHGGGTAVVIRQPSQALVKRLHRDGVCLGCFFHGWDPEEPPDPATLGLFSYGHVCTNWISGPYGLHRRPARPAHIDQLPPALRGELRFVWYPKFCFARRLHIQPVEHDTTSSWEPAYLTSDGKRIREIPDDFAPDTYAEEYEHFVSSADGWLKGIRIDPPGMEDED